MSVGRTIIKLCGAMALGAAAGIALLPLVPAVEHELGPGQVTVQPGLPSGETTFAAPPLGSITADTHVSPLTIRMELSRLDWNALQSGLSEGGAAEFVPELEDDLRALVPRLILQMVVSGLIVGLIMGGLLPRRRWSLVIASAIGGVLGVGAIVGLTVTSFDERSFSEPRFAGALARAPEVLAAIDQGASSFENLGSRYEVVAERISRLLEVAALPSEVPSDDQVVVLHVSDVHSNPLGLEFARRLASAFEVDLVIDTGDLTSFGEPIEGRIRSLVERIEVPYVYVPGNHDSFGNRVAVGRASNVVPIGEGVVEVEGLDVLAWPDPTFTADNSLSTEEGNEIREEVAEEVGAATISSTPDVLAVHDVRLAQESFGAVPLVLTGHTHERGLEVQDGTVVLTVGSTGATGLGSFVAEADVPYEAEIIYIRDGIPTAVDYVRFSGTAEEFEVDRSTLEPQTAP